MIQYLKREGVDETSPFPDYNYWVRQPHWTLWEAVFLVLGENPPWAAIRPTKDIHQQVLGRAILAAAQRSRLLPLERDIRENEPGRPVYVVVSPYAFCKWIFKERIVDLPSELNSWQGSLAARAALWLSSDGEEAETGGEVLTDDQPGWQTISRGQRARIIADVDLDLLVEGCTFQLRHREPVVVKEVQMAFFMYFANNPGPHTTKDATPGKKDADAARHILDRLCKKLGLSREQLFTVHRQMPGLPLLISFPPASVDFRFAILRGSIANPNDPI